MPSIVKKTGLLLWTLGLFFVYTNMITFTPWPTTVVKWCGDAVGAETCRATVTWYFWLYAGYMLAYLWLVLKDGFLRPTALLLLGLGLFHFVQPFTLSELSHIQTYTYEMFIVAFYSWAAWLVMGLAACLLWPNQRSELLKVMGVMTLAMTFLFALKGRGSVEHINPLIGGLLKDQSLAMLKAGFLWKLCAALVAMALLYNPFYNLVHWIQHGTADLAVWKRSARLGGTFLGFALMPLASLPIGLTLNGADIREAKAYVDKITPQLEEYYKQNKSYPDRLDKLGLKLEETPRLLDIYDYIAYGTKGGFYLARPEKYCFIFPSQDRKAGYWSLTSVRTWRLATPDVSLEYSFETVCDENKDDIQQQMIAGHLGMPDPNDPLTQLGVEGGQVMPMQRATQAATPELQRAIDELGYKDPTIYYKPPQPAPNAVLSPEKLLEELKKQPLRQD